MVDSGRRRRVNVVSPLPHSPSPWEGSLIVIMVINMAGAGHSYETRREIQMVSSSPVVDKKNYRLFK